MGWFDVMWDMNIGIGWDGEFYEYTVRGNAVSWDRVGY